MTVRAISELKLLFEKGDKPTAQDFVDLIDSFLHAQGGNFPNPLPAVSGKQLTNIGDALPNPLPARDGSLLTGIAPSEYNVLPGNPTPAYASATSFVLTGDFTGSLFIDRRMELTIAAAAFYTSVENAVFAAGVTTVTTRHGMPSSSLTAVKMSVIRPAANGGAVDLQVLGGTATGESLMAAASPASAREVIGLPMNLDFEDGLNGWTVVTFGTGTVTVETGTPLQGAKSAKLTSLVSTEGAGSITSSFIAVSADEANISFVLRAEETGAGTDASVLTFSVVLKCYDKAKVFLQDVVVFGPGVTSLGENVTTRFGYTATLPAGTCFTKIVFTHQSNIFGVVGTLWVDDFSVTQPVALAGDAIATNAISQTKLKTSSQIITISSGAGGGNVVATGGVYTLGIEADESNNTADHITMHIGATDHELQFPGATSYINFRMVSPLTSSNTKTLHSRYIQASPPYDLGDGEVQLFLFAVVNSAGEIVMTSASPDPPWAYNGPTDIRPAYRRAGRGFVRRRALLAEFGSVRGALKAGLSPAQIALRLRSDRFEEVQITPEVKNADMDMIPQPFLAASGGLEVVLVDTVGPINAALADFHAHGALHELITGKYLRLGNDTLSRRCPKGVRVVAGRY